MLAMEEPLQVGGIVLHYGKAIGMQIKVPRRQFSFELYFILPLAFVFGKLKCRWPPLSKRIKGYDGKKKYERTNSAQFLSIFNLLKYNVYSILILPARIILITY